LGQDSTHSPIFAPFTEDSADRLRTLLTLRDVATRLAVCAKTVCALCAQGKLRHFRVLNAIRVAPADLEAFLLQVRCGRHNAPIVSRFGDRLRSGQSVWAAGVRLLR
jgi:hypothetical protein